MSDDKLKYGDLLVGDILLCKDRLTLLVLALGHEQIKGANSCPIDMKIYIPYLTRFKKLVRKYDVV